VSEFRDTWKDLVEDRLGFTGELVINLRTGRQFVAEVETVSDIELSTELGKDPRECMILHVENRFEASLLKVNDRLTVMFFGSPATLQITGRRTDNPSSPMTDFTCMKVVPGLDT